MLETLKEWKEAAPAISALITLTSAIVAFLAFRYTRQVNKRRATLDMVLKTFMDDAGQKLYANFKEVMLRYKDPNDDLDIIPYADPNHVPTPERRIIQQQINEYELIALGIRNNLFDEDVYKLWFQHQFMRDYESLEKYIIEVRKKRISVFCECVWLYNRWKKVPHPETAPGFFRQTWWVLTRNNARLKAHVLTLPD